MPTHLWIFGILHLLSCVSSIGPLRYSGNSRYTGNIYTNKKRDCNIAVPRTEALVLPLHPNKQHYSPLRMYNYARKVAYNTYKTYSSKRSEYECKITNII